MKRENKTILRLIGFVFILAFIIGILLVLNAYIALAQGEEYAPDVLGIKLTPENIAKLPQTPEQAANVTSEYLKKEWAEVVQKRAPFLWEIHSFLLEHQAPFNIILNRNYSFTLGFFLVLFLWIELLLLGSDLFNAWGIIKQKIGLVVGFLVTIIIAQLGALNWVVDRSLYLVFSQEAWWLRLLLGGVVLGLLIAFAYFERELKAYFSALEKEHQLEVAKESVEELEEESKGRKEGFDLMAPFRKAKKEMFDAGTGI